MKAVSFPIGLDYFQLFEDGTRSVYFQGKFKRKYPVRLSPWVSPQVAMADGKTFICSGTKLVQVCGTTLTMPFGRVSEDTQIF